MSAIDDYLGARAEFEERANKIRRHRDTLVLRLWKLIPVHERKEVPTPVSNLGEVGDYVLRG